MPQTRAAVHPTAAAGRAASRRSAAIAPIAGRAATRYTATVLRALVIAIGVAVAATAVAPLAAAQPNPGGFAPNPAPPPGEPAPPIAPTSTDAPGSGVRQYAPGEEPPAPGSRMRTLEVRRGGPSGFWTSARPAQGGAYRYRMLAVGLLALGITGFFVVRMLRKISAQRPAR